MTAHGRDGLAKPLPGQRQSKFIEQLHLVDISSRLNGQEAEKEADEGTEKGIAAFGVF